MRSSQFVAIMFGSLIVVLGAAWQFATAQAEKPPRQRWEYKAVEGGVNEPKDAELERAGADGWELVAVEPVARGASPYRQRIFYFKRPK